MTGYNYQLKSGAELDQDRIATFAALRSGAPDPSIQTSALPGGIEAGAHRLTITWAGASGEARSDEVVLKRLLGGGVRELAIYEFLAGTPVAGAMPRLLGADRLGSEEAYLYLELLPRRTSWPWRDLGASISVLDQLCRVHDFSAHAPAVREWDYEASLHASAQSTVELFAQLVYGKIQVGDRPMLRPVERIVSTLPAMRVVLNSWSPPVLLHGDLHSGNVTWRYSADGSGTAVLLDWGRARMGSPLEDVSAFLHSLGCWEPEVKRRHDTLLRTYLAGRGLPDRLGPEFRDLYWMAAACNAMSGALRYHLAVVADAARSEHERFDSYRALRDWLRIVRRADACWRS